MPATETVRGHRDPAAVAPRISVVIPTYNRAALIGQTLDAVLSQTRPPDEVIVVDDGSTDGTQDLLARYASRLMTLRIPNSGDIAARNHGLRAAGGELVAFCDSDDIWRPDFLATMAALWRAEPATRVAYANFRLLVGDRWQAEDKFSAAPPGFWDGLREVGPGLAVFDRPVADRLIRFQPFFASNLVVDRAFLLSVGGWDESVSRMVGSDFATALRLAEHAPFGVIHAPLVGIRRHAGNFSGDVQAMNLGDAAILERLLDRRPSLAPFAAEIRASINRRRAEALETAFARRDFAAVRRIQALLPPSEIGGKLRVKCRIAGLPAPLRGLLAGAVLAAGTLRSRAARP